MVVVQGHTHSTRLHIELIDGNTVEPLLKDHTIGHKNVVCQNRWSLVIGSVILQCRSFCPKCVVCQDRWSPLAVVSQDRFHCIADTEQLYVCDNGTLDNQGNSDSI